MSDQEIRAKALEYAIRRVAQGRYSTRQVLDLAEQFVAYIKIGEIPYEARR